MNGNRLKNERWREIERIFDAALEVDVDARAAFLANACNGDAALCREVESLRQKQNGHATGAAAAVTDERLGAYQLIRELAEGGMGTVWLARRADDQFQQQVAVKLLKASANSEDLLHRFRHERQILAGLNHPNIARLLDGGTTPDGRPYIVMEYVEGLPIDEYCRQHQLSIRERLTLFRQVCTAVHYAHQHLLVHRDLKPGNILVTADGTPKLLDFGIAKLLQPDLTKSYDTITGLNPMTPAYASPEQVRGEKLTTASDVYSLGVVLYELLTGHSPYRLQANTYGELVKAVCEQEPERPSIAVTQNSLRGDVDSIVLMALRKEPQARYGSVEQFSEDIRRYLDGLPTLARKGTFGYRAAKYLRRNRIPIAAAALVFLTLLGGIGATLRQARIALAAQHNAEAQQAKAETQRQRAEGALATAEDRRQQSEAARTEADQQRTEAEAQSELADNQRLRAEAEELSNRRLLYTSRMGLAMQAWYGDDSNLGRMREILNDYLPKAGEPDFRGFEWFYLWKLSHSEQKTLPFAGAVKWTTFSPDGGQVLTVSQIGDFSSGVIEVVVHDASTWQIQQQFRLPVTHFTSLSHDRKMLALGKNVGSEISVVALLSGKTISNITGLQGGLSYLEFFPDGKTLAAGFNDGSIKLIEISSSKELSCFKGHSRRISTVAVSPDGQKMVSGSTDGSVKLWEVNSGKELFTLGQAALFTQNSLFSPDGRIVVTTGSGLLRAWETATGKELASLKEMGRRMAFTPDGKTLATGGENALNISNISFLDTLTWQETTLLKSHGNQVMALAYSPNGKWLLSGSLDRTVKFWDLNEVSPVISINDQQRRWGEFVRVVLSPDGKRVITGQINQSATVWDAASGKEVMTLKGHDTPPANGYGDFIVTVSPDGKLYATGGIGRQVIIWDAAAGTERRRFTMPATIAALEFSPNGEIIAVGGAGKVSLWEISSGKMLGELVGVGSTIKFKRDGQHLFTTGPGQSVKLWDISTGRIQREFRCADTTIISFALSTDETTFVTGGGDGAARIWGVQTGQQIAFLNGHISAVSSVAISPDGKRVVTGSYDKSVRMWDVGTGRELIAFKGHTDRISRNSISFSADGRLLVTAAVDRIVKIWRAATEQEVMASAH